ncbi:neuraminidase-like domain-containing protein [Halomonas sp. EF61]|uniref:Tc toxin subunit A-related protein n=1 Tax=Halomonas sp. EF61 TaxID=2950869 RepID=UPI0032DEECC3
MKVADPQVSPFLEAHPDVDLTTFDFIAHQVDPQGACMDADVIPHLKGYQRLSRLTDSHHLAYCLKQRGLDSAHRIAALPEETLVDLLAPEIGQQQAVDLHARALDIKHRVSHLWANLQAIRTGGGFEASRACTVDSTILGDIQALPSYQEMFGNQNFCQCEACASIFGPAAYYVDLMRITDRYVSRLNDTTIPKGYRLHQRRPDLFNLPLSCATTNEMVPYLSIVVATLDQRLADELAVESVDHYLATAVYPFTAPLNSRLQRVRDTLGALDLSVAALYASASGYATASPDALAREYLHLSIEQAAFVTTPLSETSLTTAWGLRQAPLDSLTRLSVFSRQSGLSRQQITELTQQGLNADELNAGLAHALWFNLSLPSGDSVQIVPGSDDAPDTLEHLTPKTLDATNRFIRLSQWSGIDVGELGHALRGLAIANLDANALQRLAAASSVVKSLVSSWARCSSLWSTMPTSGQADADTTACVFDDVWNRPSTRGDGDLYHPLDPTNPLYTDAVIDWQVKQSTTSSSGFNVSRLRSALGLSGDELASLAELVFPEQPTVALSVANLSTLYRVAWLARACRLELVELGQAAGWIQVDLKGPLPPEDVTLLLMFANWQRQSGLDSEQIRRFVDPSAGHDGIPAYTDMQGLWSQASTTLLAPTQLTGDSIDDQTALAIYAALFALAPSPVRDVSNAYHQFVPGAPGSPLALVEDKVDTAMLQPLRNAPLSLGEAEIERLVVILNTANAAQAEVLNGGIAGPLDSSATRMEAMGNLISAQPNVDGWIVSLLTPSGEKDDRWARTSTTLKCLVSMNMACQTLAIDDTVIESLTSHSSAFGVNLDRLFSLNTLQAMYRYVDTRERLGLTDKAYLAMLAMPQDADCGTGEKAATLCRLTGWSRTDLCGLVTALGTTPALYADTRGLARLAKIFVLLAKGGFDAAAYRLFLASQQWAVDADDGLNRNKTSCWNDWAALAATCEGAASAMLGDAWPERRLALNAARLDAQRNALLPALLWCYQLSHPEITREDQLSSYLLLDVQMGGERQTSLVVEATGAVQMYLHRARANLEPGIKRLAIPDNWWQWLDNYRLWEANRKVFLYPENYLVPTLRSSSSSLFKTLESDLTQVDITAERVTAAYRDYIQGLDRLASLQFIDAFRTTVVDGRRGSIDTLFQFARTATEPYEYHWTKQEDGANWTPWSRIDVTIKSAHATPVFAFGRLFVFWVETSQVSNTAIKTDKGDTRSHNSAVYKAAIRFSFMDSNATWSTDQTLSQEEVIYAAPHQTRLSTQSGYDIFNMESLFWQKCNVQVFSRTAPIGPDNQLRIDEKIAVLYGPFLDNSSNGSVIDTSRVPTPDDQQDPAVAHFDIQIFRRARIVNQAIASGIRGVIGLRPTLVLNRELQRDYLYDRTEFLNFTDNSSLGVPPTIAPLYDYSVNRLYLQPTYNVFRTNYYGDWNNNVETARSRQRVDASSLVFAGVDDNAAGQIILDLVGQGLLTQSDKGHYRVEPGFSDNTDFSFLLGGSKSRDDTIIRDWTKQRLLIASIEGSEVQEDTFVMTAIDQAAAQQALIDLKAGGVLTTDDLVITTFSSASSLTEILNGAPHHLSIEFALHQILYLAMGDPLVFGEVANLPCTTYVVKNQPSAFIANLGTESFLITPESSLPVGLNEQARVVRLPTLQSVIRESFISADISTAESSVTFDLLVEHQIIDTSGRLIRPFSSNEDLSFLFPDDPPESRRIKSAQVRVVMVNLPTMTAVSYYAQDDTVILDEKSFIPAGLSAAQSKHVFDVLTARQIIGDQGLVSAHYGPNSDLSGLFPDLPATKAAVLTEDVTRVLDRYFDTTWRRHLHDLYFRARRLTTGAVPRLTTALEAGGIDALLDLKQQQAPVVPQRPFSRYAPGQRIVAPTQQDAAQVDFSGVYGIYFWELFFFTPRLIADALVQAGDFSQALTWLQYIFNPTEPVTCLSPDDFVTPDIHQAQASGAFAALKAHHLISTDDQVARDYSPATPLDFLFPDVKDPVVHARMIDEVRNVLFNHQTTGISGQFWRFQPFRHHTLSSLLAILSSPEQIAVYNRDPFDPYAIASLRIGAFEKATFLNTIDVLIAWGDSYFQRKTRESLNAAYLLYVMASDLLGERPQAVGPCSTQLPVTFQQILERYGDDPDAIPQFLIDMENLLAVRGQPTSPPLFGGGAFNEVDVLFCVPHNELLLSRYDTVDDRLYKIRQSLDLDGNPLLLPLFAPPIDPMALVRAAAASGTSGGFAPLTATPPTPQVFRFNTLVGNARAVVGDLQLLGSDLEQALVMQNNESFQILQTSHEQRLDQAQLASYEWRIEGAQASLDSLKASRKATKQRRQYYADLVENGMNSAERLSITAGLGSRVASFAAIGFETGAAIAAIAPQAGSPFAMTYGGQQLELGLHRTSGTLRQAAEVLDAVRELSDTIGHFQRQSADWEQLATEATNELEQIAAQIVSAEEELNAARSDLDAHRTALDNANAQLAFFNTKFDNPDYYAWRVSRASALYYQTYQLALDAVAAAQSSLQWNLASTDNFLSSDPWDAAHRGLMAAESLNLVLDRMEFAYSQKDILRQEIVKQVKLSQLDPEQLIRLRTEGVADFALSEALFDFDFPGHYCRRIKTLELSLPPYDDYAFEEIHAVITQTSNKILRLPTEAGLNYMLDGSGDPGDAIWQDWRANQTTSLSRRAKADGAFIEYFGDGEKLQRFEGTGAVSRWQYRLPATTNQFDFSTIEDLTLTLRYTALDAGANYRKKVEKALSGQRYVAALMLNMVVGFADQWAAFIADTSSTQRQTLVFPLGRALFPPHASDLVVDEVLLYLATGDDIQLPVSAQFVELTIASRPPQPVTTTGNAGKIDLAKLPQAETIGDWQLSFDLKAMATEPRLSQLLDASGHISDDALDNVLLSVRFTASVFR